MKTPTRVKYFHNGIQVLAQKLYKLPEIGRKVVGERGKTLYSIIGKELNLDGSVNFYVE